jgi:translation initiation factor 3 subunit B
MPTVRDQKYDDVPDDQLEPPVQMESGFAQCVVVDNIPVVPEEKFDKLHSILQKIFSAIGTVVALTMPKDDKGVTKGSV